MVKLFLRVLVAACIFTAFWHQAHARVQSHPESDATANGGAGQHAPQVEPEDGNTQDKPWGYSCAGDLCTIDTQILDDDPPGIVAMRISFIIDRKSGRLVDVLFRFPANMRGRGFTFAFAKREQDASGKWVSKVESHLARALTVGNCGKRECRVSAIAGRAPAYKRRLVMDLTSRIDRNDEMRVIYPSGPDDYETWVILSGFKARARELSLPMPRQH